jgi:hypothetical protein
MYVLHRALSLLEVVDSFREVGAAQAQLLFLSPEL